MNKHDIKCIICIILMGISFLGLVIAVFIGMNLSISNPDMTTMRIIMTYPWVYVFAIICAIVLIVSYEIFARGSYK